MPGGGCLQAVDVPALRQQGPDAGREPGAAGRAVPGPLGAPRPPTPRPRASASCTSSSSWRRAPWTPTTTAAPTWPCWSSWKDPDHPASAVARGVKQTLKEAFRAEAERGGARDPELLARQLLTYLRRRQRRAGARVERLDDGLATATASGTAGRGGAGLAARASRRPQGHGSYAGPCVVSGPPGAFRSLAGRRAEAGHLAPSGLLRGAVLSGPPNVSRLLRVTVLGGHLTLHVPLRITGRVGALAGHRLPQVPSGPPGAGYFPDDRVTRAVAGGRASSRMPYGLPSVGCPLTGHRAPPCRCRRPGGRTFATGLAGHRVPGASFAGHRPAPASPTGHRSARCPLRVVARPPLRVTTTRRGPRPPGPMEP